MKVCPKCGYQEFEPWRQNRWRVDVEFCWLENFRDFNPEIAKKLEERRTIVCDELYAYRLSGKHKNIVERVLRTFYEHNGLSIYRTKKDTERKKG